MSRVHLVVDRLNETWILGKMARRLSENLVPLGWQVSIGPEPTDDADINHWMIFMHPWTRYFAEPGYYGPKFQIPGARHTVTITHIDDALKIRVLKEVLDRFADLGICLSRMTERQLVHWGIQPEKLRVIVPATDASSEPRRIVMGLTTRIYPDGRKREHVLVETSRSMDLSAFRFEIFGCGWESVLPALERAGAQIAYDPGSDDIEADYARIRKRLPFFDYYLYLGEDEGSMGFLDALAAGVKTIVTPQGFHLDIPGGITHSVSSSRDLIKLFQSLTQERARLIEGGRARSWEVYAREHALVWQDLIAGRSPAESLESMPTQPSVRERLALWRLAARGEAWHPYWRSRWYRLKAFLAWAKHRIPGTRT